ncbi:potassium channel protein [Solidesulfovibrio sp.]|jgi:voltage-gated potassium channel|uniref:potassium channel family protein n=1 Tax=Solidesulfovibrio sp. TaxID=2910990 RepID=UPI000EB9BE98|nr:potassium channel protein [Solidesulfovibrio sp.]MEA5090975.1 potassium channel protein [Solidesulfovibrio sp.]HCR13644.1 potassium channel protein [Desulfovibrio sp.]
MNAHRSRRILRLYSRTVRLHHRLGSWGPLIGGFVAMAMVFCLGVLGYMEVEGWSFFDSLYQVIITLSTVGFQEVYPLTRDGRILTMVLIVSGVGTFAYLVGSFTQVLVEGRLQQYLGRRRMQKIIDSLSDHVIICGYGRIGAVVAREILAENVAAVIIENNAEVIHSLDEQGIPYVQGDATADETLLAAGLMRAKTLVAALTLEAANVYVTLTARQLNPTIRIVARADAQGHTQRLQRAGADQVLVPHLYGGVRMAQSVLRPTVTSFLELAGRGGAIDLQMEELQVTEHSEILDKNLIDAALRPRFNLIVIAIKKASGEMQFNPQPQAVLEAGDTMILVGSRDNLDSLQAIL